MQGQIYDEEVHLLAVYDSSVLAKSQIELLCEQLNQLAQQLVQHQDHTRLHDITIAGPADLQRVLAWNNEETEVYDACLHHLFEKQAHLTPDAPVVHSWDGTFTYSELNGAANRLAHHLAAFGVWLDEFVHVYFEKSAWYVVAVLAINKAGGTWVPLDPSHPDERQRQIVSQTGARLVLTSPHHSAVRQSPVVRVIEISPALDENLVRFSPSSNTTLSGPENLVRPTNAAYVLFTSGSTGVPKGLVIEHSSVCTSQIAIRKRLRITTDVRMLQFASYVFDLSIEEIFCPLLHGASVCIPSEDSKMGHLSALVKKTNVNWAILKPSYIRTTRPHQLPGLELLVLAGEAVGRDSLSTWFGKVRLINGWGPAETCVFSLIHKYSLLNDLRLTVGRLVGGYGYIVNPLVIQGPTILREYLIRC
ncbi:acetyl-CoA synthetase-like protein [Colletotrichum eremochloae]|nr:acetyl-CoA synthetase-like protein [Colletotrichum eremochloae]